MHLSCVVLLGRSAALISQEVEPPATTPVKPRFRIWEALFCPNQLDLHGLAKTEEEQNSAARNYLDLWKKESGFARDAPSGDSLWRAERFCEVSGEDRICRSGGEVRSHPIALSQRHRSGGDLHSLFDLLVSGARRFAHTGLLRADRALHRLLGIVRFPTDDTIRNLFKRFTQGKVYQFYSALTRWQIQRLPRRGEGYSLDLDSTVFERYGRQQGALKGPNPRKHGRPSHHPLLAVLAEAHFILHGWLRSGNCGTARGGVEFLKEALAFLPAWLGVRLVRADEIGRASCRERV